jgi:CHASE2 domain-containing sensor protein/signal transduction histidine kinase
VALGVRRALFSNPNARALWEWFGVGIAVCAVVSGLILAHATAGADALIYDQMSRLRERAPSDRIVIVAIDDPSLAALGAWPWPLSVHAALLDRLTGAGARGVAFDILFMEPDRRGGDRRLADALKRSGRTVLPVLTLSPGDDGHAAKVVPPSPVLAAAAAALGHVNATLDPDGVSRRFTEAAAMDGACWPHLTVKLLEVTGERPKAAADCGPLKTVSRGVDGLVSSPPRLIPFAGPPGRFRAVSASEVVKGDVPDVFFKDRLVLVGATAGGLGDRHMTTVSGRDGPMPGVEVQANELDALIRGEAISSLPDWAVAFLSLIPACAFLTSLLILRPSAGLYVGLGLLIAILLTAQGLLLGGLWAPPTAAMIGVALCYPLWSWRRLVAASDHLRLEIARFAAPLNGPQTRLPGDLLGRQMGALSRAADHFRALNHLVNDAVRSLPDATVLTDHAGVIRLANAEAARIGDHPTPEELIGTSLRDWLSRALGRLQAESIMAAVERGEPSVEITSARGSDYELSRAKLANSAGTDAGTILRLADVSAIRAALRQREEVLQLLTHDIRAPLTSILALTQSGEGRDATARIDAYSRRALAMAEGYVQFARAESYRFEPETVDLSQVVLDAVDELWPQANKKGVTLDVDGAETELLIDGDRSLATRALINLVDNAIKYSPRDNQVAITLSVIDGQAVCIVGDHGPGMTPQAAARLFEPFHRGEVRADGPVGVGLGLAVVHAVMKRHGGAVTCESQPGSGARFIMRFPLAEPRD